MQDVVRIFCKKDATLIKPVADLSDLAGDTLRSKSLVSFDSI